MLEFSIDTREFERKSKAFQAGVRKLPRDTRSPLVQAMLAYRKQLFVWWRDRPTIAGTGSWMGERWRGFPQGYVQRVNKLSGTVVPYWGGTAKENGQPGVTKAVKRSRPKGARYKQGDKQLNIATSNGMLYQFARSPLVISGDGREVTARSDKPYAEKQDGWRPWHWTERIARWLKPIVERELKRYVEAVWSRG